jgi:hypothetical protein
VTETAPPPPPVVVWYLADLVTGLILTELPLDPGGTIKKLIGKVEQNTFSLPVLDDKTPGDWADLLVDGRSMIVLTLDDNPTQGWVVIGHDVGDVTVPITGSTLEECLQRTNVPDVDATLDDAYALALLVAPVSDNFGFDIAVAPCGKVSDHLYQAVEDRKVLDAAVELQAADGGPEWRIFIDWADATRRAFTKTIEIETRIGHDRPDAIFDLDADGRGVVEAYKRSTSYAEGKGATSLIGTSEGSGSSRPMTDPMVSPWWPPASPCGKSASTSPASTPAASTTRTPSSTTGPPPPARRENGDDLDRHRQPVRPAARRRLLRGRHRAPRHRSPGQARPDRRRRPCPHRGLGARPGLRIATPILLDDEEAADG